MPKQSLGDLPPKFDLKFLLLGRPGTGKTHFTATYSKGPVHYYMLDPGGEKTVRKVSRELGIPMENYSIDYFNDPSKVGYSDFWKQLQKDDKDGFFDDMASKSGMVVFDSFTKISQLILQDVARRNSRTVLTDEKPMRIQDWGQITAWTRQLVSVIDVLPCAVAVTCHLVAETDSSGGVIGEYPSVIGGSRYTLANDFDEVYRLESVGKNYKFHFRGSSVFEAKSRVVSEAFANNIQMNDLYEAYVNNKALTSR